MEKLVDILMLPTKEATNLDLVDNLLRYCSTRVKMNYKSIHQHLYLLSDDETEEGDTVVHIDQEGIATICKVVLIEGEKLLEEICEYKTDSKNKGIFKIIATNDDYLTLPKLSEKFLKKFCELGGVPTCVVKYDYIHTDFAPNGFETFLKITSDNTVVTNLG